MRGLHRGGAPASTGVGAAAFAVGMAAGAFGYPRARDATTHSFRADRRRQRAPPWAASSGAPQSRRASGRVRLLGARGAGALARRPHDALVTDLYMGEMDGMALLQRVRAQWPDLPW